MEKFVVEKSSTNGMPMHMANELISIPTAAGTLTLAAAGLGWVCRQTRQSLLTEKTAMMGVLGAFVFAAQMVNFQLPLMPGASGHLIGAVFLSVLLRPALATVALSSVIIIQCLLFQDGGLLALGCNLINIAIVPCYLGYAVFGGIVRHSQNPVRFSIGVIAASIAAAQAGSVLVVAETAISGVLLVPAKTFLITMAGVHLLIGLAEGLITVAILNYIRAVRADLIPDMANSSILMARKTAIVSFLVLTAITAAGISLLASDKPDGLEWSYLERPDQTDFKPIVENTDKRIESADALHSRMAVMPDYSLPAGDQGHPAAGWTSLAGMVGSAVCMGLLWLISRILKHHKAAG